jgi:hypothetical protein
LTPSAGGNAAAAVSDAQGAIVLQWQPAAPHRVLEVPDVSSSSNVVAAPHSSHGQPRATAAPTAHLPVHDVTAAAAAAGMAQRQLLSGRNQDVTSGIICATVSVQQLLPLAFHMLKRPGSKSKWHLARVAAMAACLTSLGDEQQPGSHHHHHQQQQQQVEDAALAPERLLALQHLHACATGAPSSSNSMQAAPVSEQQLVQCDLQRQLAQLQCAPLTPAQQLAAVVAHAVTVPCISTEAPVLRSLHGAPLSETLHAVHELLARHFSAEQQLLLCQRLLQPQLAPASDQRPLLTALHGCRSVEQLAAVVALAAECFSTVHTKAAFVQLARLHALQQSSGAQVVLQQLLGLLERQLPGLKAHQSAAVLWGLGQLQGSTPATNNSSSKQEAAVLPQLLASALADVSTLTPRVCAQLLHGAARLQLQLPAEGLQELLQHTEQQLHGCDPRALACMLWSLAQLKQMPGEQWLQSFYSSSWRWLQPAAISSGSSSNGQHSEQQHQQQQHQQWCVQLQEPVQFGAPELAALLTAAIQLQLQPPSPWLAAVAESCCSQLQGFSQQEVGLMLWGFAKLQYLPPLGLVAAAAARAQQLGPGGFTPHSLMLFAYGLTRLCRWHEQQQQQPVFAAAEPTAAVSSACGASSSSSLQSCMDTCQLLLGLQDQQHQQQLLQRCAARDLAILAWLAAVQQQEGGACVPDATWHNSLVAAATVQLQRQQFTPQGLSMLVWGLGTTLSAAAAAAAAGHGRSSSSSTVQQPVAALAIQPAFWASLQACVVQQTADFSVHELANLLWGAGAMAHAREALAAQPARDVSGSRSIGSTTRQPVTGAAAVEATALSAELTELLACQLLDAADELSTSQASAAVQGLAWLGHPRGAHLLQAALLRIGAPSVRLAAVQPLDLLLLLRGCVAYKHVLEPAGRKGLAAAIGRVRQLTPSQLAQVLYLLGKLQMQHNQHSKRAAKAEAATAALLSRSRLTAVQQHGQQQACQVALQPVLPVKLLRELLVSMAAQVPSCSSKDASLMLWGVSHLVHTSRAATPHQQQVVSASPSSSSTSDADAAEVLLSAVLAFSEQQLPAFAPGNLATLLYALHRLRATPPPGWLEAAQRQLSQEQLSAMDGQSLAVLALAVSGLPWPPQAAWVKAYSQAASALERQGGLRTRWQRRCIANGLSALDPLAAAQCATWC